MEQWKCSVCGYIHDDEEPPGMCPICSAPRSKFHIYDPEQELDQANKEAAADDEDEFYGQFDEP